MIKSTILILLLSLNVNASTCPADNYDALLAYVKTETRTGGQCDPEFDQYFKGSACMIEPADKDIDYSIEFCIGKNFKLVDLD